MKKVMSTCPKIKLARRHQDLSQPLKASFRQSEVFYRSHITILFSSQLIRSYSVFYSAFTRLFGRNCCAATRLELEMGITVIILDKKNFEHKMIIFSYLSA